MPPFNLPKTFRLGIADADLQVIGEAATRKFEHSQETMWSVFAKQGRTWQGDGPDVGIDRYHRWKEDAELMAQLGVKHYRTSVSMSRLLHADGSVNKKALEWYRAYWTYLRSQGIAIYATLYHWELPARLAEKGAWTNPACINVFIQHTRAVYEHLGDLIDEYFTINEPWCISILSHFQGVHAPGEQDLARALQAAHHTLLASSLACRELLSLDRNLKVGVVMNTQAYYAASTKEQDIRAAQIADCSFNRWFHDPIFLGHYPEEILELYEPYLGDIPKDDLKEIQVGYLLHSLGVNNYCGKIVQHSDKKLLGFENVSVPNAPVNDLGWPIFQAPHYPRGLYDMLRQLYYSYREHGLKNLYVTENGMALHSDFTPDGSLLPDIRRIQYFEEHLRQVSDAILSGVPVHAYFAWTFMDNYEWAEGYRPQGCFGLVHVDRKTLERVPKASYAWYRDFVKGHE